MLGKRKVCIALGFFDSVHLGHKNVIESAVKKAKSLKIKSAVLTFDGDLRAFTGKEGSVVFPLNKRKEIFYNLNVDYVYSLPVKEKVLSLSGVEFLDKLNKKFDIKEYFCGRDFRFGVNASADVFSLKEYAEKNGQKVVVIEDVICEDKKISTSTVKDLLKKGEIEKANSLLTVPYSISGKVIKGRGQGRILGFPTANLLIGYGGILKQGVYYGKTQIKGKRYKALINYGNCPTFGENNFSVEVFVLDYTGNLYGKKLEVEFCGFLRDIKKFEDKKDLILQIKKDVEKVREVL